ncbi:MAG: hypothetical protein ACP5MG_12040 [Verrucomicrobiia bacterium]
MDQSPKGNEDHPFAHPVVPHRNGSEMDQSPKGNEDFQIIDIASHSGDSPKWTNRRKAMKTR